MFEAKSIDFSQIPDQEAQYAASAPGVGFAASGGVAKAVEEVIEKLEPGRQVKTVYAEGLRECRQMLRMARTGKYNGYLLEGMACPAAASPAPAPSSRRRNPAVCWSSTRQRHPRATLPIPTIPSIWI